MKKLGSKLIVGFLFGNLILLSFFPILNNYGAAVEINPKFGEAPIIDGIIDDSAKEWKEATKVKINLTDLPADLWVMQNAKNLYISVQLDLEI